MIDNIQNNQITHVIGMNTLPHADAATTHATNGSDAILQVDFADLVQQAVQASETETDAVQKARELLQTGRLTSIENIRSAAQNIVSYGI